MKYNDALNRLKTGKDKRFVLSGDELYLKDQFIKAARVFFPDARFSLYHPEDKEGALDALTAGSLFDDRIVVFIDIDKMNLKGVVERIEECDFLLIMVLSEQAKLTKRDITKIISLSSHVQINKMKEYGGQYQRWILSRVSNAGYEMKDGAEDVLFETVGPDMFMIASELKKLMIFKSEEKTIFPVDIQKVTSRTARKSAYDIMERLLWKDTGGVLRFFRSYSRGQDNFIELVSFLGKYMEKFYRILLLNEKKMDVDSIGAITGIHPYLLKTKYLNRVKALGKVFIAGCYDQLCKLDVGLRTFRGNKRVLTESTLIGMIDA